jgi:hypothetical protein
MIRGIAVLIDKSRRGVVLGLGKTAFSKNLTNTFTPLFVPPSDFSHLLGSFARPILAILLVRFDDRLKLLRAKRQARRILLTGHETGIRMGHEDRREPQAQER